MATAPTGQKVAAGGTGLADAAALLSLVGGQRGTTTTSQTSNAGDTAALQQVLSQLQGADYSAMLQSIFQRAGAEIPGIQAAYGRSMGARSYNNSSVQAALSELLKATTVAAQEQMAKQQLANQQTQVQAGQAVANATKGTQSTQTQKTSQGLDLQRAAALLALWQGIGQLTKGKGLGDIFGGLTGGGATTTSAPATAAPVSAAPMAAPSTGMAAPMAAAPVTSAASPNILGLLTALPAVVNAAGRGFQAPEYIPPSAPVSMAAEMGVNPLTPFAIPGELGFGMPSPMPATSYTPPIEWDLGF